MYRFDEIEAVLDQTKARMVATTPIVEIPGDTSCGDAWEWMQPSARDLSVVLLSDASMRQFALRSPEWKGATATVAQVARDVPSSSLLRAEASLRDVLDGLAQNEFCLIDGEPSFIVTAADLGKPAGSLWAFGLILSFEDALTRLFPSLSHQLWRKDLSEGALKKLDFEISQRREKGTFINEEHCLPLSSKVKLGAVHVAPLLGISKKKWKNSLCGSLETIRNDLAHGRPLGTSHSRGQQGAIERLLELRRVVQTMWDKVDDRDDVWQAYRDTLVEFDGAVPATPFWMLSAQNPREERLSDKENQERHQALCENLKRQNCFGGEGWGRSAAGEGAWSERMALMTPGNDELACEISRHFGQRSAFRIENGFLVVLDVSTGRSRGQRSLGEEAAS